jgi:hypothetical protein
MTLPKRRRPLTILTGEGTPRTSVNSPGLMLSFAPGSSIDNRGWHEGLPGIVGDRMAGGSTTWQAMGPPHYYLFGAGNDTNR